MLQRVTGLEDEETSLAPHGRVPALDGPLGGSWFTIVVGLFTILVGFLVVVYFFWKVERLQFHLPFLTLEMGPRSSASEPEPEDAGEVFEDGFFEDVPLPTDASLVQLLSGSHNNGPDSYGMPRKLWDLPRRPLQEASAGVAVSTRKSFARGSC